MQQTWEFFKIRVILTFYFDTPGGIPKCLLTFSERAKTRFSFLVWQLSKHAIVSFQSISEEQKVIKRAMDRNHYNKIEEEEDLKLAEANRERQRLRYLEQRAKAVALRAEADAARDNKEARKAEAEKAKAEMEIRKAEAEIAKAEIEKMRIIAEDRRDHRKNNTIMMQSTIQGLLQSHQLAVDNNPPSVDLVAQLTDENQTLKKRVKDAEDLVQAHEELRVYVVDCAFDYKHDLTDCSAEECLDLIHQVMTEGTVNISEEDDGDDDKEPYAD